MMKDAAMKEGDAMMKKEGAAYGSGTKDAMKKGDHMMKKETMTDSFNLNCPAGTKGQADGTCMIVDARLYAF